MWILCAVLSIVFHVLGWILLSKHKISTYLASGGSLSFVSLTLLMEYKIIFDWVNHEDWISLLDVVPTVFILLAGYVIVMILANAILIGSAMKMNKSK